MVVAKEGQSKAIPQACIGSSEKGYGGFDLPGELVCISLPLGICQLPEHLKVGEEADILDIAPLGEGEDGEGLGALDPIICEEDELCVGQSVAVRQLLEIGKNMGVPPAIRFLAALPGDAIALNATVEGLLFAAVILVE